MKIISKLLELLRKDQGDVWVQTVESGVRGESFWISKPTKRGKILILTVFAFLFLVALYRAFSSRSKRRFSSGNLISPTPSFSPTPASTLTPKIDVKIYLQESINQLQEEVNNLSLEDPSITLPQIHLNIRL